MCSSSIESVEKLHLASCPQVGTLALKVGARKGCSPRDIGSLMSRQGLGKSPIEKLHVHAVDLAVAATEAAEHKPLVLRSRRSSNAESPMAVDCVADEAYLHQLEALLEEYFDEYLLEGLQ